MRFKIQWVCFLFCFITTKLLADEGMWLLPDLKQQNELIMKEMGLNIPVDKIYNTKKTSLKDAAAVESIPPLNVRAGTAFDGAFLGDNSAFTGKTLLFATLLTRL